MAHATTAIAFSFRTGEEHPGRRAEIFSDAGYKVDAAGSGSETIEMLTRQSYDLIFCDLDLPKKSGFELVRMARALNRDARIVVTSARANR